MRPTKKGPHLILIGKLGKLNHIRKVHQGILGKNRQIRKITPNWENLEKLGNLIICYMFIDQLQSTNVDIISLSHNSDPPIKSCACSNASIIIVKRRIHTCIIMLQK